MDWTKPVFRTDLEFKTCYHTEGLRHADPGWDAYFADVIARDPMIQHSIKHANDDAYYAPPPLEPDVNDITNFVEALFARADEGTFVNLRAFSQSDRGVPPPYIRGVRLNGAGRGALIDEAVTGARFAANAEVALVFAPPVATFRSNRRAREADLANALSLSVELDTGNTTEARGRLEGLLGPCTVIVASGGEWTDPETGATFEKLHLHWRLSEPTREPADHARLKRVRGAACNLVNADRSATPPSHPLRWPGSWHLKGKPRLARIIALNPSAEISLDDAEAALGAAQQEGVSGVTPEADPALIASALAAIPNADLHWDSWIRLGLAVWRATGGSTAGFDAWRAWSQKSQKFTTGACEERWEHFAKSPPSKIGAGSIFYAARAAGWTWPKGTQSPVLRPEAPLESATVFLNRDRIMHHLQGTFYEWQGTHYSEVAKEEMRAQLYTFLHRARRVIEKGTAPFDPTKFKVANVLEAVAAEAQLPSTTRPPMWLDDNALPPTELIACANGLLHFPKRALLSHSPAFFTLNALPFDYDPTAPAPAGWLTFLDQLWSKDQDTINTLQEIFGLLLTGDTRHEKAFLLVGPKRSGKGTIARILRKLIGPENVCGPTLSSLATTFGLMPLIGKRLAIISDARIGGKTDQNIIVERILAITGEDALTIDRKHRDQWNGYLETRFVLLTIELPRLTDASGALASRFITLIFTESFYGREDLGLTDKLTSELPGILNWALKGLDRLQKRGHFVPPKSSAEAQRALEDLGSPVGAFLRDRCLIDPRRRIECNELFLGWAS